MQGLSRATAKKLEVIIIKDLIDYVKSQNITVLEPTTGRTLKVYIPSAYFKDIVFDFDYDAMLNQIVVDYKQPKDSIKKVRYEDDAAKHSFFLDERLSDYQIQHLPVHRLRLYNESDYYWPFEIVTGFENTADGLRELAMATNAFYIENDYDRLKDTDDAPYKYVSKEAKLMDVQIKPDLRLFGHTIKKGLTSKVMTYKDLDQEQSEILGHYLIMESEVETQIQNLIQERMKNFSYLTKTDIEYMLELN